MSERRIDAGVGMRVHQLIGFCLANGVDAGAAARAMFAADPLGGTLMSSVRTRCSSATAQYLARCRPQGWDLVGYEEQVGRARADLVWAGSDPWRVLIDEIKTGVADADDPRLLGQIARLLAGGARLWGDAFVGVRVIPLASPRRAWLTAPGPRRPEILRLPESLEVR